MKRWTIIPLAALAGACLPHPPPPPAPYRAVGVAPANWTLIIDDRYVTFFPAPGQQPLLQPTVKPIPGIEGRTYQTPRIRVIVVNRGCSDMRTDRIYPDHVQVDVDGRVYRGCGGL